MAKFEFLQEGERVSGEWFCQAHGTRYELAHEPSVAFDLIRGQTRALHDEFDDRCRAAGLLVPNLLHVGGPISIKDVMAILEGDPGARGNGFHGAIDPVEGAVWRCERQGAVDFLGKYVRPDKIDGKYLPELSERFTTAVGRRFESGDKLSLIDLY
ncbi:MAG TPA: RNA ligase family protein [Tepidisphaeraceae bacterium]|nr:RNA ligase family protein [Tepidisphaeraceae bacterium]